MQWLLQSCTTQGVVAASYKKILMPAKRLEKMSGSFIPGWDYAAEAGTVF
jgi:hypothetical protein